MKAVIFSGGPGTRFWPISRSRQSKTVAKTFNNQSFLQATVARLATTLGKENIYIATGKNHQEFLRQQVPQISESNFILEPAYKDTAMAVLNATVKLNKIAPDEPFGIFWSDHLIKKQAVFAKALQLASETVKKRNKLVYLETPIRFPNINLGYARIGKQERVFDKNIALYQFVAFLEKPSLEKAKEYFQEKDRYCWNTGYLIATPKLLLEKFAQYAPDFYQLANLPEKQAFAQAEKASFDYVLAEKLTEKDCLVLVAQLGWYDVGEWGMVKEAFSEKADDNVVIKGQGEFVDAKNTLVYGQEGKLVAIVGLEGVGVIDTKDALLVVNLKKAHQVKTMVNKLKENPQTEKFQ